MTILEEIPQDKMDQMIDSMEERRLRRRGVLQSGDWFRASRRFHSTRNWLARVSS
jgi:hypothetical protein